MGHSKNAKTQPVGGKGQLLVGGDAGSSTSNVVRALYAFCIVVNLPSSEKRRLRNRTVRTRVRSALKTARAAVTTAGEDARAAVLQAIRTLDKAVTKGVIHRNTAARKKSALARRLNVPK